MQIPGRSKSNNTWVSSECLDAQENNLNKNPYLVKKYVKILCGLGPGIFLASLSKASKLKKIPEWTVLNIKL